METLWEIKLDNGQIGSMKPVYENGNNCLYFSDGWGSEYSSIRLRRIDISTGKQSASDRLRDSVFSMCFTADGKSIITALGKRLILLDRDTLTITKQWKARIPRYSNYINLYGKSLLLMNWLGPTLNIYDIEEENCTKKKLGSCMGIFPLESGNFLIYSGKEGVIWRLSVKELEAIKFIESDPFKGVVFNEKFAKVLLAMGNPFTILQASSESYPETDIFRIYDLKELSFMELKTKEKYIFYFVDSDFRKIFLINEENIDIYAINKNKMELLSRTKSPNDIRFSTLLPDLSIIIGSKNKPHEKDYKLVAMKI